VKAVEITRHEEKTLFREASIDVRALQEGSRTVELSFSSEDPYMRWFGPEILRHDAESIDLGRLQEIGVMLWNHNSDVPIGRVEKVWIDGTKAKAVVTFDEDEESDRIFKKVQAGSLKGVSVGYRVTRWEILDEGQKSEDGRFTGPCDIATRWEPLEISIVSVPADATVGVGRSLTAEEEEAKPMADEVKAVEVEETQRVDVEAERAAAVVVERERSAEVTAICREYELDPTDYIKSGASADEVRKVVLAKVTEERKAIPGVTVEVDEADKFRSYGVEGILARAGLRHDAEKAEGSDFRGMSLMMLADRCLSRAGDSRRGDAMEWTGRAMATGDFQYICGAIANKAVMEGWDTAEETWRVWAGTGSLANFNTHTLIGAGLFPDLPEVKEHAEYTYGKLAETHETIKMKKFGELFALTREAIINDDTSLFSDVAVNIGDAASHTVGNLPYGVLTANATMADGVTLFHSTHGNKGTSGVVSVTTIAEAIKLMKLQKDVGENRYLHIRPQFLLAPVAKEGSIEQFFKTDQIGAVSNSPNLANPYAGTYFTRVYDPRLDASSPAVWYLAGPKNKTVKVFFLNGKQSPWLESKLGWTVDGIEWKVRMEAVAGAVDYRGLVSNAGV
jgi:HK97 family phage prohead protease